MGSRKHIWDLIPVDSAICFAVEAVLLLRLFFIYAVHFKTHPVLTTMVANAILNGLSDTFAQTLTTMRARRRTLDRDKEARLDAIREEYDLSMQASAEMLKGAERPFDYERLARFVCYGYVSAILQFKWFAWLEDTFPIAGHSALVKRLLADQLFYAPFSLLFFFGFMNLFQGGSRADLRKRLEKQYVGALKAQYILWPAVQIINFKFVPLMYQLPLGTSQRNCELAVLLTASVSSVNVGWNIYLSFILGRS
ncbi:Putative uncharacterized protein [Taphrina deformans PYCC 5710]|uniref:Protein sym1 n=1 Tax=Taphrina deformans (strain PYCC 5710 / ATCC 11124 / CBS 356.35 / IMI 108563 / JCM 9778 / NBRC 8474) TaxID=1097556 RepID=R4XDX9_TAPDE|nr:Putative uncharacterized protein [Taphrina deformans PYCC 5710]|eukprot:CCG81558.1 Putative uncharacterized protein [Taphrina deformans PYCC 5710]